MRNKIAPKTIFDFEKPITHYDARLAYNAKFGIQNKKKLQKNVIVS